MDQNIRILLQFHHLSATPWFAQTVMILSSLTFWYFFYAFSSNERSAN
jgi:hypothetical protein